MKKNLIVSVIVIGLVCLIIVRLVSNKQTIDERKRPAKTGNILIPVSVAPVTEQTKQFGMIKTGVLIPFKEAKLLSASNGSVRRVLFNLGDEVHRGQVLAVIDTRLLELDLQKSTSNVSKLSRDLQTYTELLQGNAATQEKVNEIHQQYTDAVNQTEQLKKQMADASVKAPIDGVIGAKSVEEGMYVATNTELATIVNLSQLKVLVNVTEAEVYQIGMGQNIKLSTEVYPGRTFSGTISYISPQANQAYSYQVEVTARNEQSAPLRSGTFVYTDFSKTSSQTILLIPREALNESIQNASVYVVKEGKAILRKIKVGTEYQDKIEVINGLQKGEQIVTSGQINLKEGSLIQVSK